MGSSTVTSRKRPTSHGPVVLVDHAIHILRTSSPWVMCCYYIGTLPFCMAWLYFWADMSYGSVAVSRCAAFALGLAILFVWMKTWHCVFLIHIRARLHNEPTPTIRLVTLIRIALNQTLIQASGWIVLPLALVIMVPFSWAYAFYQNCCVLEDGNARPLRTTVRQALHQANQWPGQHHLLLAVFGLFGLFVFLNLAVWLMWLPGLLKTFLGMDTRFTLAPISVFNSTFLATVFGLTWVCLDPILKTVYALRCFLGLSRKSGQDLKAAIKRLSDHAATPLAMISGLFGFLTMMAMCHFPSVFATQLHPVTALESTVIQPQQLDESIRQTLQRSEFQWRLPRKADPSDPTSENPMHPLFQWIADGIKKIGMEIKAIMEKFSDWLRDVLSDSRSDGVPNWDHHPGRRWAMKPLTMVLVAVFTLIVVIYGIRVLMLRWKKVSVSDATDQETGVAMDLTDDELFPDDLEADQWKALSRQLLDEDSPRLALRSIFLGALAILADQGVITLGRSKTNGDYLMEIRRRAHAQKTLQQWFADLTSLFNRVWYGMYPATHEDVTRLARDLDHIPSWVRRNTAHPVSDHHS